jgi:hypothetical protein
MLSPRQIFYDNILPADPLLKVFRLLEHDAPNTEEGVLRTLRELVQADHDEDLTVIYNAIFLGLIGERAEIAPASIKRSALCNMVRQAIVTACTALETYLPTLPRNQLPEVIKLRGREFVPKDTEIKAQFTTLTFDLDEVLRVLVDPDPLSIGSEMISFVNFSYLSGKRGIHVTGTLSGTDNPWRQTADRLRRGEEELKKILDDAVNRRNDIRASSAPAEEGTRRPSSRHRLRVAPPRCGQCSGRPYPPRRSGNRAPQRTPRTGNEFAAERGVTRSDSNVQRTNENRLGALQRVRRPPPQSPHSLRAPKGVSRGS